MVYCEPSLGPGHKHQRKERPALIRGLDAVELATLEWVDWYNNRRLFEALGDIPPAEAESAYYATMTPSESPRMAEPTLH
jgi:transposase InsO family protein